MKKQLNEVKRMQQLAGILKESQLNEEIDVRSLVGMINSAKKAGQEIAVNGSPVTMWVAFAGKLKTMDGSYSIDDIIDGNAELTIDGEPVEMPSYVAPSSTPSASPSPEDVASWQDRFGPGGGSDGIMGRYTGD